MKKWFSEAEQELQECFNCTDWSVFEDAIGNMSKVIDTVESCQAKWNPYRSGVGVLYKEARNALTKKDQMSPFHKLEPKHWFWADASSYLV